MMNAHYLLEPARANAKELDHLIDLLADTEVCFDRLHDLLREVGDHNFAALAEAAERALVRHAGVPEVVHELPWILRECAPDRVSLVHALAPFLLRGDAPTVRGVFEVLVELGDPGLASLVAAFDGDTRPLPAHGARGACTLADVARAAIARLYFGESSR